MKNLLAASLVILAINAANAQTNIGLKLSPYINAPRISYNNDSQSSVDKGSNAFNPQVLLFADFPFGKNYYFSTGVGYLSKRINLNYDGVDPNLSGPKQYNNQYVQLPATIKLFTNEVALDKKLYFQFGPLFDIAVHHKEDNPDLNVITKFQPIDISMLFAAGMQFQIAPQTAIQIGLNYTRGLVNVAKDTTLPGDLSVKNNLYGIDIALKF